MKKVVLLNSGGLDSALKAKELFIAMEPVVEGEPAQQRAYEIYSLSVEVKGQLGLDNARIAALETANRYCDHHHVMHLDLGFTPNEYKDANNHFLYDDVVGSYADGVDVALKVFDPPTRVNLLTEEIETVPLWSGPPNLSSVMLSLGMSYGAAIVADELHSGLTEAQAKDAAVGYKAAFHAIHASWQKYGKWPVIIVDEAYTSKEEKKIALSDTPEEFDYVTKSVPPEEIDPTLTGT